VTSRLIEILELPSALIAHRVAELGLHAPSGRSAFLTLASGDAVAGTLSREDLIGLLRERAETAGVTFVHGTFQRFRHGEGDYPVLEVQDAQTGEAIELNAEVVVAADGAASRVAWAAGLPRLPLAVAYQERFSAPAGQVTPETTAHVHFGRKVSADYFGYLIPSGDQLVAGVTTEIKYGKRVWDGLSELKKRLDTVLKGAKAVKREAFIYPLAMRAQLTHDRLLFVGDAGGLTCPASRDGLFYAAASAQLAAETILAHQHMPLPERLAGYTKAWQAAYGKVFAAHAKIASLFFLADRRREALIDMAWDREAGRYAIEAFMAKRPFSPPFPVAVRLKAKLTTQLMRYNMMSPKRLEGDTMVRSLPPNENYLDLALKSRTGPLTPPASLPHPALAPAETLTETIPAEPRLGEPDATGPAPSDEPDLRAASTEP
jgi:flavin-dependent dehydrogenase